MNLKSAKGHDTGKQTFSSLTEVKETFLPAYSREDTSDPAALEIASNNELIQHLVKNALKGK